MGKFELQTTIEINAPIELVFERITDHEAMAEWPGVQACSLVREGNPRNGLGAIRKVKAGGISLLEEVVQFEPPHRYDYSIIKGLPVDHRGTVTLSARGAAVLVTWQIRLASRWPLLCEVVGRLLGRGLPKALAHFKAETERLKSSPSATSHS